MLNKVLCVDDDEVTLMICKIIIAKCKFSKEVAKALNGQQALDIFTNNQAASEIQLILLDINMPVLNGWDFMDAFSGLSAHFPNVRVAILSSSVNPEDVSKAKTYPQVLGFISKPLTEESVQLLKDHAELKMHFTN